jgi:O-antigen ligase
MSEFQPMSSTSLDADLGWEPQPLTPPGPPKNERRALRALQLGAIAVVLVVVTYRTFELDRFFVPKELALHVTAVTAGFLMWRSARRPTVTWVDLLLGAYIVLGFASTIFATNRWVGMRALTLSAAGLAIFWAARALRDAELERPLLGALAIAVVIGVITSLLQTYGVRTDLFSINRSPGGTLGNRNFVAHMAAFGFPVVLLTALRATRGWQFVLATAGSALIAASLILTRSRAGWLAALAALFVFVAAFGLSPLLRRDRKHWLRAAVVLAISAGGVVAALLIPNSLRWRSDNPYLESFTGVANFQEGSGAGRLVQYRQSLEMMASAPLLGVGPGNWPVEYPAFAARRDPSLDRGEPGTTSNPWPSSDWVAIASERGLPAAILLLGALALMAFAGLRQLLRAAHTNDALTAAALLATLAAAAVAGTFDAVLLLALPALLIWATLGSLWSPLPAATTRPLHARLFRHAFIFVTALAALGVLRSTSQLVAMAMYSTGSSTALLRTASFIDPGNYRIHLRLARAGSGLRRASRCNHARAANALYPRAGEARALSRACGRQ